MRQYVASHLKGMNRKVVYQLIADLGQTSKAELSKRTGISTPTVIKIVSFLIEKGLVVETGEGESAMGRKPQMLRLNRDCMYFCTFLVEGEFLSCGVMDITGRTLHKKTMKTLPDFDGIMARISGGLVEELLDEAAAPMEKLMGIGIAIPGIYDPQRECIQTAPLIGIREPRSIREPIDRIRERYHVPVLVENDSNCQCLGEFRQGDYGEGEDLVFISVGTGLGAGVILDGRLRRGAANMCGEIGYVAFLDDYVAGMQNAGWLENRVSYQVLQAKFDISRRNLPVRALEQAVDYVSIPLALCVNNIAMLLDCHNIVVGGVVAHLLGDRLIDALNKKLSTLCINDVTVRGQTDEDGGLIGIASMLARNKVDEILTGDD